LIITADTIITFFSNIHLIDKKWIFSEKQRFVKVNLNREETVDGMLQPYNEQFGTRQGVRPQTILWEFARYYPAETLVEATNRYMQAGELSQRKLGLKVIK
jgi:hypothetical protein